MFRRRQPVPEPVPDRAETLRALRALVAEAVIWQDEAEALLAGIRDHEPAPELGTRGGRLVSRFSALRERLPDSRDPEIQRQTGVLAKVFDHHALLLSAAVEQLASEREPELTQLEGLGAPAEWLEAIWTQLSGAPPETGPRVPAARPPAPPAP